MSRRSLVALITGLLALAAVPSARAVTYTGQVIDGPDDALTSTGSLDMARDGSGGIAYVKGGRVWVATTAGGVWNAPTPIDAGVPANASDVHLSAVSGGAIVVAWLAGGRVWAAYRPPFAPAFDRPVAVYGAAADGLSVDLSVNLKAYLAFHASGNVRVAELANGRWSLAGQYLDANTADDAGAGGGRPDIAVASDGTAVVVWGENGVVYARRVRGTHVSTVVVPASLVPLEGHPQGTADHPLVGVGDDDSFATVIWRQSFNNGAAGVEREVGRTLRGSAFDPLAPVDGLTWTGEAVTSANLVMAGNAHGMATVSRSSGQVWSTPVDVPGLILGASRADLTTSTEPPQAVGATAEHDWAFVVSRRASATGSEVIARQRKTNGTFFYEPETVLSVPGFGAVDPSAGLQAGADDVGDLVAAFVQGTGTSRRLVVGGVDFPPATPTNLGPTTWQRTNRPRLIWTAGDEHWGPRWAVTLDGLAAGTAYVNRFRPAAPLADGVHTYQVREYDRRGQASAPSRVGTFRIDTKKPTAKLKLGGGTLRARNKARIRASGSDGPTGPGGAGITPTAPAGSGLGTLKLTFGDHSKGVTVKSGHTVRHTYKKAGRFTITLRVSDVAGNVTKLTKRVRVLKPKKKGKGTKHKSQKPGGGAGP